MSAAYLTFHCGRYLSRI